MKKNIIKRIIPKRFDPFVEEHIAQITGKPTFVNPVCFKNIETGDEYSWLSGGLAWPSSDMPGYAVIIAVKWVLNNEPSFMIIDEVEDSSVHSLLQKCLELRDKYMSHDCFECFQLWYGEYERYATFLNGINAKLNKPDSNIGFYLLPPYDFEKPNRFEIYLQRLQEYLTDVDGTGKKLTIGKNDIFRNHLQNLPPDALKHGSVEQYPAVSAVGFIVHSLIVTKPWERQVTPPSFDESNGYNDERDYSGFFDEFV